MPSGEHAVKARWHHILQVWKASLVMPNPQQAEPSDAADLWVHPPGVSFTLPAQPRDQTTCRPWRVKESLLLTSRALRLRRGGVGDGHCGETGER